MGISRRRVLTTAVAGSAIAAVGGTELVAAMSASAASPPGDVVGKITVGYQGWFAATGDGSPINGWWHWSQNWGQPPSPSNTDIISWPDMREYTRGYTDRVRQPRQRPAGPALLLLRPADRRHPLPVDAAVRLRHRRAAALQPDRRRGPDPRRDGRQGPPGGRGVRAQVLHHVRRHQLDEHAVADQDRLDDEDVGLHRLAGVRPAERQAGRLHLGLRLQRPGPPVHAGALPRRHQLVQGAGLLRHRRRADLVADRRQRLAARLHRRLPRVQHDLAVDGRPDRRPGRRSTRTTTTSTSATRPTATRAASTTSRA